MYFRAEITSYLAQYPSHQEVGSAVIRQAQAVQAKELAEARHTVDELEQSLVQERGRTAALTQEVDAELIAVHPSHLAATIGEAR